MFYQEACRTIIEPLYLSIVFLPQIFKEQIYKD